LVEPGFLGVSQGAAFGAALSIVCFGSNGWHIQLAAIFFALLGLGLTYLLSHRIRYGGWILRLIMSGICVSAVFMAGLGIFKYLADPLTQLAEITFWTLGGLNGVTWGRLLSVVPLVFAGIVIMFLFRWRLNLLSLTDKTAFALGTSVQRERLFILFSAVIPTAAVISIAGMVGWIGLIIPHISRRVLGADSRYALPGAMLMGGMFSVLCDDLARNLLPGEIPLGIITSLFGAIVFLGLMLHKNISVHS
jgi:iron complex transport system permease protein